MSLVYRVTDSTSSRSIISEDLVAALKEANLDDRAISDVMHLLDPIRVTVNHFNDYGIQVELLKLEQAVEGLRAYQRKLSTAQDAADAALKDRNEYILMLRNAGASVASMTEPLGMSRAQVNRIANPKK